MMGTHLDLQAQLVSMAARESALSDSALGFPHLGTQRVILDYWLKKQASKQGTKWKGLWKIPLHTIIFFCDGFISFGDKIVVKLLV